LYRKYTQDFGNVDVLQLERNLLELSAKHILKIILGHHYSEKNDDDQKLSLMQPPPLRNRSLPHSAIHNSFDTPKVEFIVVMGVSIIVPNDDVEH
jgi:hypothetical protein